MTGLPLSCLRPVLALTATALILCLAKAEAAPGSDDTANQAKNLARTNCGARIDRVTSDGYLTPVLVSNDASDTPSALLLDDNTLSCPLPHGDTVFIIALPRIALLDRFSFIIEEGMAGGDIELAVSNYRLAPNDSRWVQAEGKPQVDDARFFSLSLVGTEAKYVRITFHVQKEGRIAGLALYGKSTLQSFADLHNLPKDTAYTFASTAPAPRAEDTLNFNFANLYARAHVVYVSSGSLEAASRMIDDDNQTTFRFSSTDKEPTVIIELAANQRLHRVSAVYLTDGGNVDVYLLDKLSGNPGDLRDAKPISATKQTASNGKIAIDFDSQGAHYVALRWHPGKGTNRAFEVAEVGAFSIVPLSMLSMDPGPALASNFDGFQTLVSLPVVGPISP